MRRGLGFFLLLALAAAGPACADPYAYVMTPYNEKGEVTLRLSWGTQDERTRSASGQAVALGWSPTTWWYTELWAAEERERSRPMQYDGWYWSNQLHLGSSERSDFSFYASYWKPRPGTGGWNWTIGPMWQYSAARVDFNLNVLVSRWVHPSFRQQPADLSYQAQAKTLLAPGWEWGAQMYGDLGPLANPSPWREQEHQLGPAIFGHRAAGSAGTWRYDAALLFGLNNASPRALMRAEIAYSF
ncbi:hypothetical protein [Pelomonas sp. KK5]|uniref:hypothetical protein n=1 Tax=Pelomonas sp. KK5 TaxID=1855730 RepID=UPI0011812574|nr:hypothetical protein [Pelomonas sp. KK5]